VTGALVETTAAQLLDALEEGVVLTDGERVSFVNRAAARLLEVDAGRAVGTPLIWVLRDHRLEQAIAEGRTVELETRGRWLQAVPVQGALLLRDLTELRRAREDARELLAVLSHELRTPVTAIRAALEALAAEPPDTLRTRFLGRATQEAERLVRLLEDLTVDVRPPRERSLVLAEVAGRAAAVVQPVLQRHGVRLELSLPAMELWADEDKLLQVLINLLENAAVHGPSGGRVTLAAWADGPMARVEVWDEGEPLDPTRVEELFAPHSRGLSAKAKGTGLGLYIVRSIARRWGGEAWGGPRHVAIGRGAPEERAASGNAFGFSVPCTRQRV
jgi:two-component system phosphate regulon sensor histidine kinase PhoR